MSSIQASYRVWIVDFSLSFKKYGNMLEFDALPKMIGVYIVSATVLSCHMHRSSACMIQNEHLPMQHM